MLVHRKTVVVEEHDQIIMNEVERKEDNVALKNY
jgi:hypothetical protein